MRPSPAAFAVLIAGTLLLTARPQSAGAPPPTAKTRSLLPALPASPAMKPGQEPSPSPTNTRTDPDRVQPQPAQQGLAQPAVARPDRSTSEQPSTPHPAPPIAPLHPPANSVIRQTIYTDSLPAGVVQTQETVREEEQDGQPYTITTITHYRRPYHPLPTCWIAIPSLRLRARIVEGVLQRDMARGPGHFPGTALPGEVGNCAIAAHSNVPGCDFFRSLHRLRVGDSIYLETLHDTYRYQVEEMHMVRPTDTRDLLPVDYPRLTLVTCSLPSGRYRLIVTAAGPGGDEIGGDSPGPPPAVRLPIAGRAARRVIRRVVTRTVITRHVPARRR